MNSAPTRLLLAILVLQAATHHAASQAPNVPGFRIDTYAEPSRPVRLAFNPDGILFAGNGENQGRVWRVEVGGAPVTGYGAQINDPDAVVYDVNGTIGGVPGSVLVGGEAKITAIRPGESNVVVFDGSPIDNPSQLRFDRAGRLLIANLASSGRVLVSAGEFPTVLFSVQAGLRGMGIDDQNRIFTSAADGVIRVHDEEGNLLDDSFATGLGEVMLAFGRGGRLGNDLYAVSARSCCDSTSRAIRRRLERASLKASNHSGAGQILLSTTRTTW